MKRMILATLLVTAYCTASFSGEPIARGETFTTFGKYKVELADDQITLKGQDCKTYVITYENSPMEVKLAVSKERNCRKYVVLSDRLSVQYVCNKNYFGVEMLDKAFKKDVKMTSMAEMDRSEYFHQKIISPGSNDEIESIGLVATYFPRLLTDVSETVAAW
jgi:hypothetical protein